ncbi:MAG: hypothetical protein D6734_10540 [Candidatus Schekmanbacteria bacterium]|nr:MAG: hypothetical protein D6734_10540 [Candidatus Schekmanbacteria bacterium]
MSKIKKFFTILLAAGIMTTVFSFSVIATDNSNSNANVNGGGGGDTVPFTPSTTIKNWHEVK